MSLESIMNNIIKILGMCALCAFKVKSLIKILSLNVKSRSVSSLSRHPAHPCHVSRVTRLWCGEMSRAVSCKPPAPGSAAGDHSIIQRILITNPSSPRRHPHLDHCYSTRLSFIMVSLRFYNVFNSILYNM